MKKIISLVVVIVCVVGFSFQGYGQESALSDLENQCKIASDRAQLTEMNEGQKMYVCPDDISVLLFYHSELQQNYSGDGRLLGIERTRTDDKRIFCQRTTRDANTLKVIREIIRCAISD